MTTQMLIYERAVPISLTAHKNTCVKTGEDYGFASRINAVPLLATEFTSAAKEFAVVFAGAEDRVIPTAVLGVRNDENLFVTADGGWNARYCPAFLRQYPFVVAGSDGSDQLTLCIDEQFSGINTEGRGERLFDSDGNRTAYLNLMLDFVQKYQGHFRRTELFCQRLMELDLLEPMQAAFTLPDGQSVQLSGFQAVNRDKIKALDGDTLKALAQTDELELLYVHLQSMQNLDRLIERIPGGSIVAAPERGPDVGQMDSTESAAE